MIAVLVIVAGVRTVIPNVGLAGLAAMIVGLAAVVVIIGMALTVGGGRVERTEDERPPDGR
jgi:hypothetical protein